MRVLGIDPGLTRWPAGQRSVSWADKAVCLAEKNRSWIPRNRCHMSGAGYTPTFDYVRVTRLR